MSPVFLTLLIGAGLVAALGVAGVVLFFFGINGEWKQKWWGTYCMGVGTALACSIVTAFFLMTPPPPLIFMVAVLLLIATFVFAQMSWTRFCPTCGAAAFKKYWVPVAESCHKCGEKLSS